VLQNALGMGLARLMGIDARVGILAGSVTLTGGPATSIAFGSTFEQMGVTRATTIAIVSATFGITVSGLTGGYIGGRLICGRRPPPGGVAVQTAEKEERDSLLTAAMAIAAAMGLGGVVSTAVQRSGVMLPGYIGAMVVAAVLRFLDDRRHLERVALIMLRLWDLAAPMLVLLAAQVVLCRAMCVTLAFRVMGRDYDAAVGAAGFCGLHARDHGERGGGDGGVVREVRAGAARVPAGAGSGGISDRFHPIRWRLPRWPTGCANRPRSSLRRRRRPS
jgi:ESS family glutamate:Na+ symporter